MKDSLDLLLGRRVKWEADHLKIGAIHARHIDSVVSFTYFDTIDESNYDSINVLGGLESSTSDQIKVSGEWYDNERISQLKVYRKVID